MTDAVRSAARVLDLLEHLAAAKGGATLSGVGRALGIPKSSSLLLLRTVVSRGYVFKDEADRYHMNAEFRQHGFMLSENRNSRLIALAEPLMQQLSVDLDETVILCVADGMHVRVISFCLPQQAVRYDPNGNLSELPFYCMAVGRIIASYSDPDYAERVMFAKPLKKLTPQTIVDPNRLRELIADAKLKGFAIVEEEFAVGGTGVAVPIFGLDGKVIAALDVGCVSSRFPMKREKILQKLHEYSGIISSSLK